MAGSESQCCFSGVCLVTALFLSACTHQEFKDNSIQRACPPSVYFLPSLPGLGNENHPVPPECPAERSTVAQDFPDGGLDPLSIYDVVDQALCRHPLTRKLWAHSRSLAAQHGKAKSAFYPQLKAGICAAKVEQPVVGKTVQQQRQTVFYPQLELIYSLFHFGRDEASVQAVKEALEASQHRYTRGLQTVIHHAQCAYCKLDSAKAAVEAEEENLRDAERMREAVSKRYRSGLVNQQEDLRAEASLCQARYHLEQTRTGVEAARAELSAVCGRPVSSGFDILPLPRKDIAWEELFSGFETWMERPVEEREDLVAAKGQLASKEAALKAKEKSLWPELVFGFTDSLRKFRHVNGSHQQYNAYVALQWNLFDGFRNTYDILEAAEEREVAEAEWQEARLKASQEIWTAYHAVQSTRKQLQAAESCREAARKSFEATQVAYQNGLASFSDLVSAQSALASARQQQVQTEDAAYVALANLGYATGGIVVGEASPHPL
ncbi:MAG: TolC family protein [Puniceicoccales bacterium]|jgi:outer membrane protein TolC|nr:TolC family protein [Puniceicoccales bacterium]